MNKTDKIVLLNHALEQRLFVRLGTECSSYFVTLVDPIPKDVAPKDVLTLLVKKDSGLEPYIILADVFDFVDVEATDDPVPDSAEALCQSVRADRLHWRPLPLPRPIAQFVNPQAFG